MRAEIISVGTELLIGAIVNTNAAYLSRVLAENAVDVYHQSTVGDNPERLRSTLERAASRSDLLVTSGGLGPTEDDITMQVVSEFTRRPLVFHRRVNDFIRRRLKAHGHRMTRLIQRQSYVPSRAGVFINLRGTAPGVLIPFEWHGQKKWLMALPGPPRELEPLFPQMLSACLREAKEPKSHFLVRGLKISQFTEAEVASRIGAILKLKPPLTVGIYARPGEVELKIMAKAGSLRAARAMVLGVETKIRKVFGRSVYGADTDTIASVVGAALRKKRKTLSVAESCTGGFLSNFLTEVPGSSNYFEGGVIAYSNAVKTELLNVSPATLKKHGAVSARTAREMALGCLKRFGTDYAVALTGIAGPSGAAPGKPVGLVYIAVASESGIRHLRHVFFGNRSEIKSRAAFTALDFLRREFL